MRGLTSQSIVIVGSGLPVEPIDLDAFQTILGELKQPLKTPVAVQAQADRYTLVFFPDRASVEVAAPFPPDAETRIVDTIRFYLKEYAGRRSGTAIGFNFAGRLETGDATGRDLIDSLLQRPKIDDVLLTTPTAASITLFFVRGAETRGQLVLSVPDDETHSLSWAFNFHYELRQPDSLDTFEALDKFAESRSLAEASVDAMESWEGDKK